MVNPLLPLPTALDTPAQRQQAAAATMACLDLTDLNTTSHEAAIDALCAKARGTVDLPPVAAVCVWPRLVAHARQQLPGHIGMAAVVNFPSGQQSLSEVLAEVAQIAESGGQEVDCVLPYQALRGTPATAEALTAASQLLQAVRRASPGLLLKVILETGELPSPERVAQLSQLALDAGADFIKTSTGKTPNGASLPAAAAMLRVLQAQGQALPPGASAVLGFKPSGGLRTLADVWPYALAVQQALGPHAVNPRRFRVGASSLWDDLAAVLQGRAGVPAASGGY
ncbi:MAG: deoxyribose-phosphate aldolase [Burkholderiaceae bacterium]